MNNDKILNLKVVQKYEQIMVNGLAHSFPLLDENEIREAVEHTVLNSYYNGKAELDNNYTKQRVTGTVLDVLHYIQSLQPIVTSSGVMYKQHKKADNPLSRMIQGFLKKRSAYKKEMFKYPKGSEEFERYNLLQLLEKINANGTYGILAMHLSMFYNIYVAEAITRQGRSYISCSIMLFESLLSNNIKFNNINEVVTFIHNVEHEKDDRKCIDSYIIDRDITKEECFYKLMNTADMTIWIPRETEMQLIWEYVSGLNQEDINRLYYKNNLYTFCDNKVITDLLIKILCKLDDPFMNPNNPPGNIRDDLDTLVMLIKEYVYYGYFYIDKLDRIEYMQRDIVIISDTDSTIISFDAWYRYLLNKVYHIDMPIKHQKRKMVELIKRDEFGEVPKRRMIKHVEPNLDYNFYTDEVIELHRLIRPYELIPQDGLMYSIINIMGYICSDLVVDYLERYCKLTGSYQPGKKCEMIMKNEFLFRRVLFTANKKNYADIQTLQEGHIVPKDKSMAIMGLPINKSTLPGTVKSRMQDILYEDILTADNIDQIAIMKKLVLLEKEIYNSIMNKEIKYYKPDNIASIGSYAAPTRINGITASIFYNEVKDENMPLINLEERNKIFKIKLNLSKKNVDKIKDTFPETYQKICRVLEHPTMQNYVGTIAFPMDSPVPDWVLEFVDVAAIVNDNLKNFPLDSIGLNRLSNDNVNYSNIISL